MLMKLRDGKQPDSPCKTINLIFKVKRSQQDYVEDKEVFGKLFEDWSFFFFLLKRFY